MADEHFPEYDGGALLKTCEDSGYERRNSSSSTIDGGVEVFTRSAGNIRSSNYTDCLSLGKEIAAVVAGIDTREGMFRIATHVKEATRAATKVELDSQSAIGRPPVFRGVVSRPNALTNDGGNKVWVRSGQTNRGMRAAGAGGRRGANRVRRRTKPTARPMQGTKQRLQSSGWAAAAVSAAGRGS